VAFRYTSPLRESDQFDCSIRIDGRLGLVPSLLLDQVTVAPDKVSLDVNFFPRCLDSSTLFRLSSSCPPALLTRASPLWSEIMRSLADMSTHVFSPVSGYVLPPLPRDCLLESVQRFFFFALDSEVRVENFLRNPARRVARFFRPFQAECER